MSNPKTIKMKREDAQLWLAALRSGRYRQGSGTLYNPDTDSYCCLGVLEEVVGGGVEDLGLPSMEWLDNHGITFLTPDKDERLLGPGNNAWLYPDDKNVDTLLGSCAASYLNDEAKFDFNRLADLIEAAMEYTD